MHDSYKIESELISKELNMGGILGREERAKGVVAFTRRTQ